MFKTMFMSVVMLSVSTSSVLAGGTSPFSVAIGGSTLGLTGEVGFKQDFFGVRGNINYFHYSASESRNGVQYSDDIDMKSYGVLADIYPFENGLRLTGGVMINRNRVDVKGSPNSSASVGNHTYSASQVATINGSIENNLLAPYIGAGYVARMGNGLELSADIGAMFQGKSQVNLSSSVIAQSDLNIEAASIKNKLDESTFYPVISIKAGYRF